MRNGKLKLTVVDVKGDPITEKIDLFLRNQILTHVVPMRGLDVSQPVTITGLEASPNGLYALEADGMSYHAVGRFINIPSSGTLDLTITLPIDPKKVVRVDFPAFGASTIAADAWTLLDQSTMPGTTGAPLSGQALYDDLGDIPKAGFLNLVAKADRTRFVGQVGTPRSVLSYITKVSKLQGDRFFASIDAQLRAESVRAQHDGIFVLADEILHQPPAGFDRDKSFKTRDHFGNLQLSFFSALAPTPGGEFTLDMDIDDASGFDHLFQVLNNIGGATHPYNIHGILIASQELDPGYDLILTNTPPKKPKPVRRGTKLPKP